MTVKTMTNLLATINDIHAEAQARYNYPPQRVFIATAMKNRILQELAVSLNSEFLPLRRRAQDGMKLLGMRFIVDHRVPEDEMHFCTKRRELMVRVKVDQQPMEDSNGPIIIPSGNAAEEGDRGMDAAAEELQQSDSAGLVQGL